MAVSHEGLLGPFVNAGAPVNGTDEVQRITIGGTPTGGTFTLAFDGYTTDAITWSSTNGTLLTNVETALEALSSIDGVTVADNNLSSGIGSFDVTFSGDAVSKRAHDLMTADASSLTGSSPTVTPSELTAGVTATFLGAATGAWLIDTSTPALYQNVGTTTAPDWAQFGGVAGSVQVLTESVAYDDFSDGGAAIGTYTLTAGTIPVGAEFLFSKVLVPAGFAGDTSAVLTIGDGSDEDRYNTGTPSVFATAASGVAMGAPSGTTYHAAAVTPVLTVTSDSDFTSVSAGSLTVSLFYIRTV